MAQMDAKKAAELLEKWIRFSDMDNSKAWEPKEYSFVKDACKAMQMSIQMLRGKGAVKGTKSREAAALLEEWADEYGLDDPEEWEKENVAFVKEVLGAIRFTVSLLKKQ